MAKARRGELVKKLQEQIAQLMLHGGKMDQVEKELIDPQPLDDDAKAALWLYAWSYMSRSYQRNEAMLHLQRLERLD